MELHNAEQPDAVLADQEAKHSSLKRAGSADASVDRMKAIGEELREARLEEAVFRKHGLYCHTLASVTKQVALLEEANQIAEQWNSHRLNKDYTT